MAALGPHGLSLAVAEAGYALLRCTAFSLWWLLLCSTGSRQWASVVGALRLSSGGTWGQLLHGMWNLPKPGIEPVSPVLAGGFLSTVPPGKFNRTFLDLCESPGIEEGTGKN